MRAVIVDDEAPARRELRRLLGSHPDVEIVGEAGDLASAVRVLERSAPDVVFLDIRLGSESGFDLIEHVEAETAVVFVTAHDDYALQAFDAAAADYLLKPIEPARLARALERIGSRSMTPGVAATPASRAWVFLDDRDRPELIAIERITCVRADGSRSRIQTDDGVERSTGRGLADWERRLPPEDFLRVHRSALVNLRHVERIEPWFHYGLRLYVRGSAQPIPVSRRRAARLRELLR